MQTATARLQNLRIAPRKVSIVIDQIRGRKVGEALTLLEYQRKAASESIKKLLLSAINNWQLKYDEEDSEDINMFISEIYVTEGKVMKRFRPASRGRIAPYQRKGSHVYIAVSASEKFLEAEVIEE